MSLSRSCSRCQPRYVEERPGASDNGSFMYSTMNWKSKSGALLIITAVSALVMIVVASCTLSGVLKLRSSEDEALKALNKAIQDVHGLINPTTTTTPAPLGPPPEPQCPANPTDEDKFDCHPERNPNIFACAARGCCWDASPKQKEPSSDNPDPVNVPHCYFPPNGFQGYRITKSTRQNNGLQLKLERQVRSGLPRDEVEVVVTVLHYDYNTARITIDSASRRRWVPPLPPIADKATERDVGFEISLQEENILTVYRKEKKGNPGTALFAAHLSTLIFSDQFLQISSDLPSSQVYGLGEMKGSFLHSVNWTRRILFNKDQPPKPNRALYGAHTLMVNLDKNNKASGVYVKNSNAMDVILQPKPAATFRAIGGIFDFFIFTGPTPGDVFSQYQRLVGFPAMVPYWSLGFHLCRYGYGTLNKTVETYERNINKGVPLEVQWNDIDYMENFNMFTYDKVAFAGLPDFVKRLHKDGRKYVMIFDPAISGSETPGTYPPYDIGLEKDIFVKNVTGHVVRYKVWNLHSSIFPDFSHPRIDEYWTTLSREFHKEIDFDGAWIDMNEPSNQLNGVNGTCPDTSLDYPPVIIGGEALFTYTACMSDRMYAGSHYDLHNLYSHLEARAMYRALVSIRPTKRPFIISRSTSSGQGLWSGHWTGDIDSTWDDLRQSIPDIINFAMYGMPMLGADICGFQYSTTEELCARWQAVGAFYPFTRNHNDFNQSEQDPAIMGNRVLNATIITLQKKYLFAPYLYTLFYRAHVYGETVVRAMMFNFASDPKSHSCDEQFMWGEGLLIAPALYQGQTHVTPYLPDGVWYHFNRNGLPLNPTSKSNVSLEAPVTDINLILRGGHILPAQDTSGETLSGNRKNPFFLFVALDENKNAHGQLFWDDGDSLDTVENGDFSLVEMSAQNGAIITRPVHVGYTEESVTVSAINIFGVRTKPTTVEVNGGTHHPAKITYNATTQLLQLQNVQIDLLAQPNVVTYF
ncbi:lysosomal alpha-glucosidase-like isoform X1 [Varroa destructor]|uniref:P-type domain-containing protein n=1 Tax=Varroa destructor TaxID=109461 RepID=A0A7M7KT79_VARDE|nr:lysosomal alpha-glucosidase-like isoform X1 [Varroa destructor]